MTGDKIDREKVIRAFEQYVYNFVELTTTDEYNHQILEQVLAMLKEQQQYIWELQDQVEYLTDKLRKVGEVGMTKIVCDRCGKEAQEENNVAFFEPHYCTETDGHRFVTKKSYDLCDECIAELIKWISVEGR